METYKALPLLFQFNFSNEFLVLSNTVVIDNKPVYNEEVLEFVYKTDIYYFGFAEKTVLSFGPFKILWPFFLYK